MEGGSSISRTTMTVNGSAVCSAGPPSGGTTVVLHGATAHDMGPQDGEGIRHAVTDGRRPLGRGRRRQAAEEQRRRPEGQGLPDRLDAVPQDDSPSLHALAVGIDRDRDAVIAGPTPAWNSGNVEGHVNRIKTLKRQMFGRAGFVLLRDRVRLV